MGYISALVRARGLGKSSREVQFLSPRAEQDGKNIVNWAAQKLEGSDGRVAIIGCSCPGAIALTDATFVGKNSPLKAIVAACSGLDSIRFVSASWLNREQAAFSLPVITFVSADSVLVCRTAQGVTRRKSE